MSRHSNKSVRRIAASKNEEDVLLERKNSNYIFENLNMELKNYSKLEF
jgi:hypothetical protein